MGGCTGTERSEACPTPMGPDMDIGNSPMLITLPDGKRALLGGTKSADVFALDPDDNGALIYRVNAAGGPINVDRARGARLDRLGRRNRWPAGVLRCRRRRAGRAEASGRRDRLVVTGHRARWTRRRLGAAPTAIPGVVFEGGGDGRLFAVSSTDGKLLWQFNTAPGVQDDE